MGGRGLLIATYCRLPDGRIYLPLAKERRRFCLSGQWLYCPTYRRHVEMAEPR